MSGNNKYKSIISASALLLSVLFCFLLFASNIRAAEEPFKLKYDFPCPSFGECPVSEEAGQDPAAYIARLYLFALGFAGLLAFGVIAFGAVQYTISADNAGQRQDALDRIYQALWGAALLFGAYLILHTINPDLVEKMKSPFLPRVETPEETKTAGNACRSNYECLPGFICDIVINQCQPEKTIKEGQIGEHCTDTAYCKIGLKCNLSTKQCEPILTKDEMEALSCGENPPRDNCPEGGECDQATKLCKFLPNTAPKRPPDTLSEKEARERLKTAGIGAKTICTQGASTDCVSLQSIRVDTLDEIVQLAGEVGPENIFITGGTEKEPHASGVYSHETGYKVDLRLFPALTSYIKENFQLQGERRPGEQQYLSPSNAVYVLEEGEAPHWDVLVPA